MSTPVSVEPTLPRPSQDEDDDLQARMQHLVDLQNEQQQHFRHPEPPSQITTTTNTTTTTTTPMPPRFHVPTSIHYHQPGVGQGTLYLPNETPSNRNNNAELSPPQSPTTRLMGIALQSRNNHHPETTTTTPSTAPVVQYGSIPEGTQPPQQHHQFHYGNPDYVDESNSMDHSLRMTGPPSHCALCQGLSRAIRRLWNAEHLHRSFCYGSIDGMLTGSGIVATFCGLHLLSATSPWSVRAFCVCFCWAACFADSICMALGHIWTTHVVAATSARERTQHRRDLETHKVNMKGRLVDVLLSKGMLKIDAMSLADTLEGYPDLFVSALLGDNILGEDFPGRPHESQNWWVEEGAGATAGHYPSPAPSWNKVLSYGQFNELEHDPEAAAIAVATSEGRVEGLFMMMGFATFAVIPSLIFLILPTLVPPDSQQLASVPTLAIFCTAAVMWCLGVWKSKFMDSNYIVFGIETVIVLLICVASSYGFGFFLSQCLPDEYSLATY